MEEVRRQAEASLQSLDPSPFSQPAFETLKEKIGAYIIELVSESVKVAQRRQTDTVSITHVEQASQYLLASTSRRFFRHLGTVGGILLGVSGSTLLGMTTADKYTAVGVLASATLAVLGSFLLAIHIAKD